MIGPSAGPLRVLHLEDSDLDAELIEAELETLGHPVAIERVRLELSIRKRGAAAVLWHGVAVTIRTAGTGRSGTGAIASDLGGALLRFYPNPPPGIVAVP